MAKSEAIYRSIAHQTTAKVIISGPQAGKAKACEYSVRQHLEGSQNVATVSLKLYEPNQTLTEFTLKPYPPPTGSAILMNNDNTAFYQDGTLLLTHLPANSDKGAFKETIRFQVGPKLDEIKQAVYEKTDIVSAPAKLFQKIECQFQ